nr:MAG TPA: Terminase small subunit [Caudoviricetes sp.]
MKLTAKQIRFVDEYLVDFNATQASIRAGYKAKTAHVIGAENLRKPKITEEIARRQKDLQKRTEISQDRVVKELARIAFANIADYLHVETQTRTKDDGTEVTYQTVMFNETQELSADQRAALAVVKQSVNGFELKLHDKIKALELLGRHIGMFNDKIEVRATVENPFAGLSTEELRNVIDSG